MFKNSIMACRIGSEAGLRSLKATCCLDVVNDFRLSSESVLSKGFTQKLGSENNVRSGVRSTVAGNVGQQKCKQGSSQWQ